MSCRLLRWVDTTDASQIKAISSQNAAPGGIAGRGRMKRCCLYLRFVAQGAWKGSNLATDGRGSSIQRNSV